MQSKNPIEASMKAILVGILVTIVLAGANTYLSLKVGLTISAAIPAAVSAIIIFRVFDNFTAQECNIVQAMASAGEATVAVTVFMFPALIILGFWHDFHVWQTSILIIIGLVLGILLSIPLRRTFLSEEQLSFPEGLATAEVIKAGSDEDSSCMGLIWGGLVAAAIKFFQSGLKIFAENIQGWYVSKKVVFGFGLGFSPALLGVGYIIGINVAIAIFIGAVAVWGVGIPVYSYLHHVTFAQTLQQTAFTLWADHIRFMGIGVMFVSGVFTLLKLAKPILSGIKYSIVSVMQKKTNAVTREDKDLPFAFVVIGVLAALIGLAVFLGIAYKDILLHFTTHTTLLITVAILFVVVVGMVLVTISCYLTGLIGSTNLPISGMTVLALILLTVMMMGMLGVKHMPHDQAVLLAGFILVVASIIAGIMTSSGMHMQCLKTARLVGGTPYKLQALFLLGVIPAVLIIVPIIRLMIHAYGLTGTPPLPGMNPADMLPAPQATLMAETVFGVLSGSIPWLMIIIGMVFAVAAILVDYVLAALNWGRIFPMALGLGMLLPVYVSGPLVVGGVVAFLVEKKFKVLRNRDAITPGEIAHARKRGLLMACGFVAGESISGILLSIPFAISKSSDVLRVMPASLNWLAVVLGTLVFFGICVWLYRSLTKRG